MATESLSVVAAANYSEWTLGSGDSRPSCIALPDDADTTYISTTVLNELDTYTWSAVNAESITSYNVVLRARHNEAGQTAGLAAYVIEFGVASTESSLITVELDTYANFTRELTKPGGGDWRPHDFGPESPYETGCRRKDPRTGINTVFVTTIDPQLTYVPANGGMFVWMSWLPPLLAVANQLGTCLKIEEDKFIGWFNNQLRALNQKVYVTPDSSSYDPNQVHKEEREWLINQLIYRPKYIFCGN